MNNPIRTLLENVGESNREQERWLNGYDIRCVDRLPRLRATEFEPEWSLLEDEGRTTIRVELPGAHPADIDVSALRRHVVTISGFGERGPFRCSAALPAGAGEDGLRARLEGGVLYVIAAEEDTPSYPEAIPVEYPGEDPDERN